MRNYGIYHQGAILFASDFDPVKTILWYSDWNDMSLSDDTKANLQRGVFDEATKKELFEMFNIDPDTLDPDKPYESIAEALADEVMFIYMTEHTDAFESSNITAYMYDDVEGEFVYDDERETEETDEHFLLLAFPVPHVWNPDKTGLPADKEHAAVMLREAGKALLKDDIDWKSRLGTFYASVFS